jgi:hypothetical protein
MKDIFNESELISLIDKCIDKTVVIGKVFPEDYFKLKNLCEEKAVKIRKSTRRYFINMVCENRGVIYVTAITDKMIDFCKEYEKVYGLLGRKYLSKNELIRIRDEAWEVIWVIDPQAVMD